MNDYVRQLAEQIKKHRPKPQQQAEIPSVTEEPQGPPIELVARMRYYLVIGLQVFAAMIIVVVFTCRKYPWLVLRQIFFFYFPIMFVCCFAYFILGIRDLWLWFKGIFF